MLLTLWLTSSFLFAGGSFPGGGAGPASSNTEWFTAPRVGLSSKEDVFRMWGKPASEQVEKGRVICAWPRGRKTIYLTFDTKLDLLVDRKVVKTVAGKG